MKIFSIIGTLACIVNYWITGFIILLRIFQFRCLFGMLSKDSRSCHPHQQGNQEQTKKHDKNKEMLPFMHCVKTHLNGSFGSFVVEGWGYVARELTEILKAYILVI